MTAKTKYLLSLIFIGDEGKLSFTALFAFFAFIVMVTLFVKGLLQGYDIAAVWLDWSIMIVEVAVIGRVGQKVLFRGADAIASIKKPKAAEGEAKATDTPKSKQVVRKEPTQRPAAASPKTESKPIGLRGNFSIDEFQSKDGAPMPKSVEKNIVALMAQLEIIREALGNKPITITSGYRSPEHNKAVGGEPNSYHMKGMAADFQVKGVSPKRVYELLNEMMDSGAITQGGLGIYPRWVHYDIRNKRARWAG